MVKCTNYLREGDEYGRQYCAFYRNGAVCRQTTGLCKHQTHVLTCATCGSIDPQIRRHLGGYGYCDNDDFHGKRKKASRNYKFTEVVTRMSQLRTSKWNDYGGSFADLFRDYRWQYIVPRLIEKVKRLESLTLKGNDQLVSDEKLEDTLMDIAVICLNAIVEMEMEGEDG